jgi:hypothetical protein
VGSFKIINNYIYRTRKAIKSIRVARSSRLDSQFTPLLTRFCTHTPQHCFTALYSHYIHHLWNVLQLLLNWICNHLHLHELPACGIEPGPSCVGVQNISERPLDARKNTCSFSTLIVKIPVHCILHLNLTTFMIKTYH